MHALAVLFHIDNFNMNYIKQNNFSMLIFENIS